jgi:hypothetical protein
MVLSLLARHWLARRLLALDVYRRYVAPAHGHAFHHLSHPDCLARGLRLRQCVRCVLIHYRFEEFAFDAAYKRAVYRDGGLLLWHHEDGAGGCAFAIRLEMSSRANADGGLTISASAGGVCLHRLSFSWVGGDFAGVDTPILPFLARKQGQHAGTADALAAFERAFPHNSPRFFCFAALRGIAQALGMDEVAGRGWRIALPLRFTPLDELPSRQRKRALTRRAHWGAIGESARLALRPHLVNADVWAGQP